MTIAKKLYVGFGLILGIMLVLLMFNVVSVAKEARAREAVSVTLNDMATIRAVSFQMMQNRQSLGNYLLSGDLRDEDKTNKGIADLETLLRDGQTMVHDTFLRSAFSQVEENERSWADNFARPMIAKRRQVDAGDATVSDLQIFYLQRDPNSWVAKSSAVLEEAGNNVRKAVDESTASARTATAFSSTITIAGTL